MDYAMRAIVLTLAVAAATLSAADLPQKRRVAVFDFDNPPTQTNTVTNPWMPVMAGQTISVRNDVGQTVADLLVTQLVRDGNCTVIERKELKRLLDEQNLGNSDRVDPTTAARLGRILGVDAIIVGSVTRYDHSDRTTGHPHNFGGFRVGSATKTTHEIKADVQITARIVSPESAEILAVAEGSGLSERKGVKEDIMDQYSGTATPAADVQNDALKKALTDVTARLEASIAQLPAHKRRVNAVVADVNSSRIIINAGSTEGVSVGDRLELWRPGNPIRDPETGKVLRWDDQRLGDAVVTEVDNASASATYTSTIPLKIGDRARGASK